MRRTMIGCLSGRYSDPLTVLLLHMDGANGETSFVDSSSYAKAISTFGNAQKTTANYKFGTAGLLLDGTGDYVSAETSADFAFGTGDFTVEMWIKVTTWATDMVLCNVLVTNGFRFAKVGNTTNWGFGLEGGSVTFVTSGLPSTGTWHHVAAVRQNGVGYLFLDGVLKLTGAHTANYLQGGIGIGTNNFNGVIDEVRVSKGVARYTANFTPATEAFLT